jgi:hypothetical protein
MLMKNDTARTISHFLDRELKTIEASANGPARAANRLSAQSGTSGAEDPVKGVIIPTLHAFLASSDARIDSETAVLSLHEALTQRP